MNKSLFLVSLLSVLSLPAAAAEERSIVAENAWARESPPTVTNGAAYMTLINRGQETDRLTGATATVAEKIEMHAHLLEGEIMKMRQIKDVEVTPDEPTVLEPGGLHLMLINLKAPLNGGETFPLTLHFEKAGNVPVEVKVRGLSD